MAYNSDFARSLLRLRPSSPSFASESALAITLIQATSNGGQCRLSVVIALVLGIEIRNPKFAIAPCLSPSTQNGPASISIR